SRLESLAEVRQGGSAAVSGSPWSNTGELKALCRELGVDDTLLLTDAERWEPIEAFDVGSVLNWLMELMVEMSAFDHVMMTGSDMRIRLAEAILGEKVVGACLGTSPIQADHYFSPERLRKLITSIKGEQPSKRIGSVSLGASKRHRKAVVRV